MLKPFALTMGRYQTGFVMKKIGVSSDTVGHWKNGEGLPSAKYIDPLAEMFGITPDQLVQMIVDEKLERRADRRRNRRDPAKKTTA
jgi:transcriptional regulator with XRE-family HTH domain